MEMGASINRDMSARVDERFAVKDLTGGGPFSFRLARPSSINKRVSRSHPEAAAQPRSDLPASSHPASGIVLK
jgi:hypothetical protein